MSDIRRPPPQPSASAIVGERLRDDGVATKLSCAPTPPRAATWMVESLDDVADRSLLG